MSAAPCPALAMSDGQRESLEVLARAQSAPHRQVQRARALLMAADGVANTRIAARVGVTAVTVRAWRKRFGEDGLAKLGEVREGRGPKPSIPAETVEAIVEATLHSRPTGQTHWSTRTMAKQFGVSRSTVHEIWSARGLKPHLVEDVQGLHRPGVRGEARRRGGSVSGSARSGRWCCAWTRRPRSRHSTAPSRRCR